MALALPALGALVAEPMLVVVDSAMVGRLGAEPLAGLTVSAALLTTAVGLCVFLAYATTAAVARRVGAGDAAGALALGMDGVYLAAGLGAVLAVVGEVAAPWAVQAMGASGAVAPFAEAYLRWSLPGLPGMLVVLAAAGALRGLQDTRSTLYVAAAGAAVNAGLNAVLIFVVGMGIAGSGLGTALTQWAMALALVARVAHGARRAGADLRPRPAGIWAGARAGLPLFWRTVSLRTALLVTVAVAGSLGDAELAAHQAVNSMWGLAAFALDALAIAAQALVGVALGAGDRDGAHRVASRTARWGAGAGVVLGLVIGLAAGPLAAVFTDSAPVRRAAAGALVVAACCMPLAGYLFALDGVLMGAGDGRYLAWAGMATLAAYLPLAWAVWRWADGAAGLAWLWAAFAGGFMAARALADALRVRSGAWLRV